jgi:transcriptional regulator with XRE-family HTH domain
MDWTQIISELKGAGFSQARIAEKCGCGQATISELAMGRTKDPQHSLGQKLLDLHASSMEVWQDRPKAPA